MRGENSKFRPILRLTATLCDVEGKKIENISVNQWLLAYNYVPQICWGRLNGDGDRRGRLYGGKNILRFFAIISRYISVTVQHSPIVSANDY